MDLFQRRPGLNRLVRLGSRCQQGFGEGIPLGRHGIRRRAGLVPLRCPRLDLVGEPLGMLPGLGGFRLGRFRLADGIRRARPLVAQFAHEPRHLPERAVSLRLEQLHLALELLGRRRPLVDLRGQPVGFEPLLARLLGGGSGGRGSAGLRCSMA